MNVNFLRTAHYPNYPYTYLIADRLGLAIMEEIPVWWLDEPLSWAIQNNLRHIHEQMFREMIFRDYNRPSIVLWSTCNECQDVDGRKVFIQQMNQELDSAYPDGRLVTQSAAADRPGPGDPSQAVCDVAGWTMYFGIFHGGTYYDGTRVFLARAHIAYPAKPILDTEFGYWSGEDGGIEQKQVEVFNQTFRALSEWAAVNRDGQLNPFGLLMASTWWTAFDWYTAGLPRGFQSMGLYHMDRSTEKPACAALREAYRPYYENSELVTEVGESRHTGGPVELMLEQNYPNPFNPSTTIRLSLKQRTHTRLSVHDILGREVAVLVNEVKEAGTYSITFPSGEVTLPSGVYFYRLVTGDFKATRKVVFVR